MCNFFLNAFPGRTHFRVSAWRGIWDCGKYNNMGTNTINTSYHSIDATNYLPNTPAKTCLKKLT